MHLERTRSSETEGTLLSCRDLCVSFESGPSRVPALSGVSLEVKQGEFVSVIGPSGCGKTTLLRTLGGMINPEEGWVRRGVNRELRVLLVFQENGIFPWMTVLENAAFGLEMQGVKRAEREKQARELLTRFGLEGRENAYPRNLSLGMKQRVAVVRSFVSNPDVLLMDEPFAALDAQSRSRLQQDLLALWQLRRVGVLFITHDIDEAILLSDRILVMSRQPGRIIGTYSVPLRRPRLPETALCEEFIELKRCLLGELELVWRECVA